MKQFDKHADAYNEVRWKIAYPEKLYELLSQRCPKKTAALDIGCGNGVSTVRLKKYFDYVEGADLGQALIEKARANYPGIHFSATPAEHYNGTRRFDLVTSATSFYWMDRDLVLQKMATLLEERGVFCAYKYDFPVVYGPLRDLIERELALKWAKHRDPRLITYDDTLERMQRASHFSVVERQVLSNIIDLTPREVALFFLSASYVTRYIDQEGGEGYIDKLIAEVEKADSSSSVKVNFDIHLFIAQR